MSRCSPLDLLQMAARVLGVKLSCTRLGWLLDVDPCPVFGKDHEALLLNVYRWNQTRWAALVVLTTLVWGGASQ